MSLLRNANRRAGRKSVGLGYRSVLSTAANPAATSATWGCAADFNQQEGVPYGVNG